MTKEPGETRHRGLKWQSNYQLMSYPVNIMQISICYDGVMTNRSHNNKKNKNKTKTQSEDFLHSKKKCFTLQDKFQSISITFGY